MKKITKHLLRSLVLLGGCITQGMAAVPDFKPDGVFSNSDCVHEDESPFNTALKQPLIDAVLNGNVDQVRDLIDRGANPQAQGEQGHTVLMAASSRGSVDVVGFLLETQRAGVNAQSHNKWTALMYASWSGHIEVVRMLIKARAEVNAQNHDGETALIMAAQNGHADVVQALIDARADVSVQDYYGRTALIVAAFVWACGSSYKGHIDSVQALIEARANVNVQDKDGWTALICPSCEGCIDVVNMLLAAGANPSLESAAKNTAIAYARRNEHEDVVHLLRIAEEWENCPQRPRKLIAEYCI